MAVKRDYGLASGGGDGRIRFLIVDDHPHGREGMRDILEAEPRFTVVGEAASGEEALEAVRRLEPDIVLMDVNMPGMGGLEAAQLVKRWIPDVRIVMVTAHDEPAFLFEALRCGAQGFLPKNVRPSIWLDYLRAIANDETPMSSEVARMLLKTFTGGGAADGGAGADAKSGAGVRAGANLDAGTGASSGAEDERRESASGAARPARRSWLSRRAPMESLVAETLPQSRGIRTVGVLTPLTAREREVLEHVASGESNREIALRLGLSEHTVKNHLKNILQKLHLDNRVQLARYAYESGIVSRDGNQDGDEAR
jgi:DNA-binding NarL/FixJ family response regulator